VDNTVAKIVAVVIKLCFVFRHKEGRLLVDSIIYEDIENNFHKKERQRFDVFFET
jgi:hypothetical protein